MDILDKFLGCIFGGAVGDALGSPVEFMGASDITNLFGEYGITRYQLTSNVAPISDDTQMTLFTLNGLIRCLARENDLKNTSLWIKYIYSAYQEWLLTQSNDINKVKSMDLCTWISKIPELNHSRAPGNTCLEALGRGIPGSIENPINRSKGCGGIMRVAPIGLLGENYQISIEDIDIIGAEAAALTHGHSLGYLPAAVFVHLIHRLTYTNENSKNSLEELIEESIAALKKLFNDYMAIDDVSNLLWLALDLSRDDKYSDLESIEILGKGWTAEEALAISIYCSAKYSNEFERAIVAAVNHGGDSDSTGSITGNIVGTRLGIQSIPRFYLDGLELTDILFELTNDLYLGLFETPRNRTWISKYL